MYKVCMLARCVGQRIYTKTDTVTYDIRHIDNSLIHSFLNENYNNRTNLHNITRRKPPLGRLGSVAVAVAVAFVLDAVAPHEVDGPLAVDDLHLGGAVHQQVHFLLEVDTALHGADRDSNLVK